MPRKPRQKSESGIYHVMLRGINHQTIFEDDGDYRRFLDTLEKYKAVSGYTVFAYCLMSNHVHLLLKVGHEELDTIMKRIGGSYVYWYNWKYSRKGHLFQDRFRSEPVEDDAYFLMVLRYIHQNPMKADIVKNIDGYLYSSYNEYIGKGNAYADKEFVLSMLNKKAFIQFHQEENDVECLDIEEQAGRLSDAEARKIIRDVSKCDNVSAFQTLTTKERDTYIGEFKKRDLSLRQISRLTGVSFAIVRRI